MLRGDVANRDARHDRLLGIALPLQRQNLAEKRQEGGRALGGLLGQVGYEAALPAPARVFRRDQQGFLEEAGGLVARAFGSARPGSRNILAYYMAGPVHIGSL